jgi:HlyD family secretion protein
LRVRFHTGYQLRKLRMPPSQVDLSVLRGSATSPAIVMSRPASRWKTRVLLPAAILTLFTGMLAYTARDTLWPAMSVQVVPVVLKTASGTASVSFQAAGWVEADPYVVNVSGLTDGIVKDVLVLEGQAVEAGQVVVRLVDDEAKLALARAEADVLQREAEVASAKAGLRGAQRDWDNPVDRTRAVAMAEGATAETVAEQARLETEVVVETARAAELEEQLRREVSAGDAIPEIQSTQTRLKLATQRATIKATMAKKEVLAAKLKQLQADEVAARENLKLRISEEKALAEGKALVAKAEAALLMAKSERDSAALRLQRMEVRAPSAGVVMERMSQPGSKLMVGMDDEHSAHAVRLYDPKKLQVRVDVPLAEAASVSVGQSAQISVEVQRDTVFQGKVTRIVHQADIQKNTLQVKVAIENPSPELKPEMLARVQFVAREKPSVSGETQQRVFAVEKFIHKADGQTHAWIVDKGRGVATKRSVTLGSAKQDGWVEVTQGLQPGDALITADPSMLKEGAKVRVSAEADTPSQKNGDVHHGSH